MSRYQRLIKLAAIAFLCHFTTTTRSQSNERQRVLHKTEADSLSLQFGKVDTLTIMGKISNPKKEAIKIYLSTYEPYHQYGDSIQVNKDGRIFEKIPVIDRQALYFYANNTLHRYFVNGGDTLDFSWDDLDPRTTFKVFNPNPQKDTVLQIETAYFGIRDRINEKLRAFKIAISNNAAEKEKITLIEKSIFDTVNGYYNESVQAILAIQKKFSDLDVAKLFATFDHILTANYFESINLYNQYFSLPANHYTLFTDTSTWSPELKRGV